MNETTNKHCPICNNNNITNSRCQSCGWILSNRQLNNPYLPNEENNLSFFYYKYWYNQIKIISPNFVWSSKNVSPTIDDVLLLYKKDINHKELTDLGICMICKSSITRYEIDICPVCAWTNTIINFEQNSDEEILGPNYLSYDDYQLWYNLKKKVNPHYTWDKFKIGKSMKEDLKELKEKTKHFK